MRKLLFAVVILAVILLAPLLAMRSETTLLVLSDWAVDSFTDLRLVLRDPVLRPLEGKVSASEIHLYPKADDGPPFLSVLGFSGNITAMDIYRGDLDHTSLQASEVIVYVSNRDQTSDPEPRDWLGYAGWLPENLHIGKVHLVSASEKTYVFPLRDVSGRRTDHDHYRLTTTAQYDGEPLTLEIGIAALRSGRDFKGLGIDAHIVAGDSNSVVNLRGDLRGTAADLTYNLQLDGKYTELAYFTRGFSATAMLEGSLDVHATMKGDSKGFLLSDATFELDNAPEYRLDARGELQYQFGGENQLQLSATGEMESMALLLNWLKFDLTPLGRARGSAQVSGSLQDTRVETFTLESQADSGLLVKVTGNFDPLDADAQQNEISLQTSAPALAALQQWTGKLPFEPGPFKASAKLRADQKPYRLNDLAIEIGTADSALLHLTGSVGALGADGKQGLAALEDLKLKLALSAPDSEQLRPYLGAWVPAGFKVDGNAAVAGNGERLQIQGGTIHATGPGLALSMRPSAGTFKPAADFPLDGLAAAIAMQVADTASIGNITGKHVPHLGQLAGTAQLQQSGKRFSLEDIDLSLGGAGLDATGTGRIPDLAMPAAADLALSVKLDNPEALFKSTGLRLAPGGGTFTLNTGPRDTQFKGDFTLGKSSFSGSGALAYRDGAMQQLQVAVDSPMLYLRDLGLQAEIKEQEAYKPADKLNQLEFGNRLEKLLRKVPDHDTDIRINLGGVEGENTRIQAFQLHMTGAEKRYTLRQFSVTYDNSQAEVRGIIDLNANPPFASLAVEALSLPLQTLTRDLGIDYPVKGYANLRGGLTAQGTTSSQLLGRLDGSLAVALEDAEIAGAAYDVLATDLLAWFYSGAALEKSTHIDCTMAEFKLNQGVADADDLYIETSRMVATGKAKINLGREQLNVTITPRSKSRDIQVPSEIHIRGPFKDPSITVSPMAAAFDATAELITLVPRMARKLFGMEKHEGEKRPCIAG
ncbi:AsmA-like C-terminal region-containing protein [Haliea sp. E17]|uniref:AsmA family protein n=1 Tax=Haliea sp. E17 TaxID=3401576 RepID=UPI003AAEF679